MPRLVEALQLSGNPFEHYVAETEPSIAEYAVKPPYFEALNARARNTSSFILFGDRGAGKSATRLTIFKELWAQKGAGGHVPLAVSMTDFSAAVSGKNLREPSESRLVAEVAFIVIESLLAWLSSLEEQERDIYLGAMTEAETSLCYTLLRDYYLSRPEAKRYKSAREAMELLNQAFVAKTRLWVEKRWDAIASIFGKIGDAVSKKHLGTTDISKDVSALISRDDGDFDSVLLLRRLVDVARIFAFTGIAVLIDKVDETEATNNSANNTAAMIHPLLAKVQLMEVGGFCWIFFLWSSVKGFFESNQYHVRLDKIGHATVSWTDAFLLLMLNRRAEFYSSGRLDLSGLFEGVDINRVCAELIRVSTRSPRELIRLMDIIIREHDIFHGGKSEAVLLNDDSVQKGLDVYVTDVITAVYGERLLAQLFRLNRTSFTNKDVQMTFRVGAQSARTRIQSWENAGIVKLTGTRASESSQGGKPANEYTIIDARVERVMERQLVAYAEPPEAEPDFLSATDED